VTQQNAALVEEASAAAESMQDQAAGLLQAVSIFKLDGTQAARPVVSPVARPVAKPRMANAAKRPAPKAAAKRTAIPAAQPKPRMEKQSAVAGDWEEF
jgi:hypothetical protein